MHWQILKYRLFNWHFYQSHFYSHKFPLVIWSARALHQSLPRVARQQVERVLQQLKWISNAREWFTAFCDDINNIKELWLTLPVVVLLLWFSRVIYLSAFSSTVAHFHSWMWVLCLRKTYYNVYTYSKESRVKKGREN